MLDIEHDIRRFVVDNFLFGAATELSDRQSFLEAAVIDSTGVLELVGFIESTYAVAVEDRELIPANLDSIAQIARFVRDKLAQQEAARAD